MAKFHHDLSSVMPMWARAHLAFKHIEHMGELAAANFELLPRESPEVARRMALSMMRGQAAEARVKAATHFPFPLVAHRPSGRDLN